MKRIPNKVEQLKTRLREGALAHAQLHKHPYYESQNKDPDKRVVMFYCHAGGTRHGNFIDESFRSIMTDTRWGERLSKSHKGKGHSLPAHWKRTAKETDSSNSSDALLMNIFCHPGVRRSIGLAKLLGFRKLPEPEFGYMARVAKRQGGDETEVDMKLDGLFVESKLTEPNFTSKVKSAVHDYVSFRDVFDLPALPNTSKEYDGYQLIRNILAARQHGCRFMLLYDARRPDLAQQWWLVVRAIEDIELRQCCELLAWQQIASVCPKEVSESLAIKYGIS